MTHVELVAALELVHVHQDLLEPVVGQVLELFLLFPRNLVFFLVFRAETLLPLLLLLKQVLISLFVELRHGLEVVVGAAVTLDVDTHRLKHFKILTIAINFK